MCLSFSLVVCRGPLSVSQLADIIGEKPISVIKFLMTDLGIMASMTQSLDTTTAAAVCEGFGKIINSGDNDEEEYEEDEDGYVICSSIDSWYFSLYIVTNI